MGRPFVLGEMRQGAESEAEMGDVIAAFGTKIYIGDGEDSEEFTLIPHVGDIDGPEESLSVIEWRSHSSPSGYTERMAGSPDVGAVTFPLGWVFDEATHVALQAAYAGRTKTNFQIEFPDGDMFQFAAYVTKLGRAAPVDDVLTRDVELSIDGALTAV